MPIPLKTALIGEDSGVRDRAGAADPARPVRAGSPLRRSRRGALAVDQPRLFRARRRSTAERRDGRARAAGAKRYRPVRPLRGDPGAGVRRPAGRRARRDGGLRAADRGRSRNTLRSNALDPAFKAEAILLPQEAVIADRMESSIPTPSTPPRERLRDGDRDARSRTIWPRRSRQWPARAAICRRWPRASGGCAPSRSACSPAGDPARGARLAKAQFDAADNMTDRQGALARARVARRPGTRGGARRPSTSASRTTRWCSTNGSRCRPRRSAPDTWTRSSGWRRIPPSRCQNPNRLRALAGSFAMPTNGCSTMPSGRGYRFLADMILAADRLNPQVAARLVPPLGRWRRFEPSALGTDARSSSSGSSTRAACRRTSTSRRASRWARPQPFRPRWRPWSRPRWRRG